MKLQRNNKYKRKITSGLSAVVLSVALLTGCTEDINIEIPEGFPSSIIEQIIETPESTQSVEIIEPIATEEPIATTKPIETEAPTTTPEPTVEPTKPEYEVFDFDSNIVRGSELQSLIYEMPDGTIKIVLTVGWDGFIDEVLTYKYYDIYTGNLVYSEYGVRALYASNPLNPIYTIPYFEDATLIGVYSQGGMILDYIKVNMPVEEYAPYVDYYSNFFRGSNHYDMIKPIEEYQIYYENVVPEQYRVAPYEIFPELEEAKVKSIG